MPFAPNTLEQYPGQRKDRRQQIAPAPQRAFLNKLKKCLNGASVALLVSWSCPPRSRTSRTATSLLEHFQFETLCVSNHTAWRFAEKTRFFRSLLAGRRCAAASHFAFFKVKKLYTPADGLPVPPRHLAGKICSARAPLRAFPGARKGTRSEHGRRAPDTAQQSGKRSEKKYAGEATWDLP